jgi:HAD superfamily hydrolase (TIGR01549 family)
MIKAVILDMDGTITQPVIDWKVLRASIGAPQDQTIMQHIRGLEDRDRDRAEKMLLETELQGTQDVALNPGFHELLSEIEQREIKKAVVTNNHGAAMTNVLRSHNLTFDVALSRDDGELKPSPDLIKLALQRLACDPANAIGVGDSNLDMAACGAANVRCVYLTHGKPQFHHEPSVSELTDLIPFL